MPMSYAQGSYREALAEDQYYQPDEWENEDGGDEGDKPMFGGWRYGPDPDEAHDRMMDDRMEREAEESWQ